MQIELNDFLAWVRTQDPLKEFNWNHPELCAAAQYLDFMKVKKFDIFVEYYYVDHRRYDFPLVLAKVYRAIATNTDVVIDRIPITFGALGDRIDAEILNNQKET